VVVVVGRSLLLEPRFFLLQVAVVAGHQVPPRHIGMQTGKADN
jgi:hypothetical protein